jgi:hypothetical protein
VFSNSYLATTSGCSRVWPRGKHSESRLCSASHAGLLAALPSND